MRRISYLIASCALLVSSGLLDRSAALDVSNERAGSGSEPTKQSRVTVGKVDINRAAPEDLGHLPGIKEADVVRIIQRRPYRKLDELVTKKVLGKKQFALIRERIVVGPGRK